MRTSYIVAPKRRVEIESEAAAVRRSLDLDPLMPIDGWRFFQNLGRCQVDSGRFVIPLTYGVETTLEHGAIACARYEEDEDGGVIAIVLTDDSYDDLERRSGHRARFSVCHELGHAVLHTDDLVKLTRIDHERRAMFRSGSETPAFLDSEWQANMFAGSMLVPGAGLLYLQKRERLTVEAIAKMYNVSTDVAHRRLEFFRKHRGDLLKPWI